MTDFEEPRRDTGDHRVLQFPKATSDAGRTSSPTGEEIVRAVRQVRRRRRQTPPEESSQDADVPTT